MLDTIPMDEVTEAMMGPDTTFLDIALTDLGDLTHQVRMNRFKHTRLAELSVSDNEIAVAILEHARSQVPADYRAIIIQHLAEQKRQSRYLRIIAWAAGLWLFLTTVQLLVIWLLL